MLFVLLTLATVLLFYQFTGRRRGVLIGLLVWASLHAGLALAGFYATIDTRPPRLALALAPMLLAAGLLGFTRRGAGLRAAADPERLHYLQGVRVVVEVVFLEGLYRAGTVAEAMTFHGQNWDILPGVLGPLVGYLYYRRHRLPAWVVPAYNALGIVSLLWTFSRATLSAPTTYQTLGLEQPTVAIFGFPYILLPAVVAPLMIWAHCLVLGKRYFRAT